MPPTRPLVHAHRGAPLEFPENTVPGFAAAIAAGADFIELDLGVSRDGALVVSHDPWIGPDRALIRTRTLDQVRSSGCPALDEVFALAPRARFGFNIEIKSFPDHPDYAPPPDEFAAMVVEAVRRAGLVGRALIQSFDFRVVRAAGRTAPEIPRAALWEGAARPYPELAAEAGAGAVSIARRLLRAGAVEAAHAAGIRVLVWTVNGPTAWDEAIAARVDDIITDDAAGLLAHLANRAAPL